MNANIGGNSDRARSRSGIQTGIQVTSSASVNRLPPSCLFAIFFFKLPLSPVTLDWMCSPRQVFSSQRFYFPQLVLLLERVLLIKLKFRIIKFSTNLVFILKRKENLAFGNIPDSFLYCQKNYSNKSFNKRIKNKQQEITFSDPSDLNMD